MLFYFLRVDRIHCFHIFCNVHVNELDILVLFFKFSTQFIPLMMVVIPLIWNIFGMLLIGLKESVNVYLLYF